MFSSINNEPLYVELLLINLAARLSAVILTLARLYLSPVFSFESPWNFSPGPLIRPYGMQRTSERQINFHALGHEPFAYFSTGSPISSPYKVKENETSKSSEVIISINRIRLKVSTKWTFRYNGIPKIKTLSFRISEIRIPFLRNFSYLLKYPKLEFCFYLSTKYLKISNIPTLSFWRFQEWAFIFSNSISKTSFPS